MEHPDLCTGTALDSRPQVGTCSLEEEQDPSCSSGPVGSFHTTLPNHRGSQCSWELWCPQVQIWWLQNVNYWECYELAPNLEFRTSVVQWQYLRFHVQYPVLTPGQGMCLPFTLPQFIFCLCRACVGIFIVHARLEESPFLLPLLDCSLHR